MENEKQKENTKSRINKKSQKLSPHFLTFMSFVALPTDRLLCQIRAEKNIFPLHSASRRTDIYYYRVVSLLNLRCLILYNKVN